jgi:hypothetical protein
MMPLTSSEIEHIAQESARKAVRELLLTMGVDTSDPKAVIRMQKNIAHIDSWREASETMRNHGLKVAVGIIVSGVLGAVYMLFQRGGH